MRELIRKNRAVILASVLGAVIFLVIYGPHVLNPCYTDWLMASEDGDLTQHYLGWKFYRSAPWKFPFGLIDTLAYPNATSVIFTDSIPLFAVLFKLIRGILPADFQYFGWWGLLCFILQGGVSAKILQKFSKGDGPAVAGSLMFVLCPVFIDRMFWMTSLSSHFLCLLGILFIVYHDEVFRKMGRAVRAWGLLGVLCASIHIYFLPMCGLILCGFLLVDAVREDELKGWRKAVKVTAPLFAFLAGAVVVTFLFGGFGSGMKAQNDGLGYYSFNLNGFLNPQGWSRILPDLPCTDSQYEGMAYLGAGGLLLLFMAAVLFLGNVRRVKMDGNWWRRHIPLAAYVLIFAVSIAVSASTVIMLNGKVLLELHVPKAVFELWSVFRATGRLIWPAVYLLLLFACCADIGLVGRRTKCLALVFCAAAQLVDMGSKIAVRNEVYGQVRQYDTLLSAGEWRMIGEDEEIRHICFVSDITVDRPLLFSFGDYASDYGKTLNNFYFARTLGEKVAQERDRALAARGEDTLFVWKGNEAQNCLAYDMNYYRIDNLIVGSYRALEELTPLTAEELCTYVYVFEDGKQLNNGEDADGVRIIHPYGNSYGPYLHAGPGEYEVVITGSGLSQGGLKCYYGQGGTELPVQAAEAADDRLVYRFVLPEAVTDLECAVWNTGAEDLRITEMTIALR